MREETTLNLDPRLVALRHSLRSREVKLSPIPAPFSGPEGERIHASVAVVFREGPELELLMIRRAESERDPWSGQMALPGGRGDASDPHLLHTAVRETAEETSVSLDGVGSHLGRLEAVVPATRRLPPIAIYPFVFGVPTGTVARAASPEVDEVLWVPLPTLQDPESRSNVEIRYGDNTSREFPCLRVEGRVIWGLTYRILTGLFGILGTGVGAGGS